MSAHFVPMAPHDRGDYSYSHFTKEETEGQELESRPQGHTAGERRSDHDPHPASLPQPPFHAAQQHFLSLVQRCHAPQPWDR